jgi:Zn-dependent M32 family carboxypeptidase
MAEEVKKEGYEFSVGGYKLKYSNKLLAMIVTILPIIGGTLWGAFEWYAKDQSYKKKIDGYVAPDLSEYDKRIALVEESSQKSADYTRDIKNDLKQDIRRLENVVEQVERSSKQSQRETEKDIREMRKEVDNKIKKALDNPLAGKD